MDTTQVKLLAVSADMFARKGFSGVSMRDIAKALGITQAAIYHHFANKEKLYYASVRYLLEEQLRPLLAISEEAPSAEEKLGIFVDGLLQLAVENPHFGQIYYRELMDGDDSRLAALAADVLVVLYPVFDAIISELTPQTDSHFAITSLLGLILHHTEVIKLSAILPWSKPEHSDIAEISKHITNLLINGLKVS